MLQDSLNSTDLIKAIEGNLTVELLDATTEKVIDKQETHNFISQSGIRYIKWLQRANYFKDQIYTLAPTLDTDYAPLNPFDTIVLTDSVKSPDSANEGLFDGKLIGYGSKSVYSGGDTLRGSANVVLSQATSTYTKWVFDWPTNAANGSISSIGWANAGDAALYSTNSESRFSTSCTIDDTKTTNVPSIVRIARASASVYYGIGGSTYSSVLTLDVNFVQTASFTPSAQFKASTFLTGITWDYTNNKIWVLGVNASNAAIMASYNTSGTLIDGPITLPVRTYSDIAFAGTNFWLIGNVANTYNLSNAPGAFTAYEISPAGADVSNFNVTFPKTSNAGGNYGENASSIAYDQSSQRLYVATIGFQQNSGYYNNTPNSINPTPRLHTYTTTGTVTSVPTSLYAWLKSGTGGSRSPAVMNPSSSYVVFGGIDVISTNQILSVYSNTATPTVYRLALDGMGSRAKLSSTITKSNLQTLRITYQMDYT